MRKLKLRKGKDLHSLWAADPRLVLMSQCLVLCTGFLVPWRRNSSALWEAWPVFLPEHSSSVQLLSCVRLFVTPWTAVLQASLSISNSQSLLNLMSLASVMPSKHLILCHSLLFLPSIFPSIRVFSKSVLHIRWPKYWSFSFSISPSYEYSGLIFFRMDWFDFLLVQGTLKSLLQYHSLKPLILHVSAFFMVPLSYPYVTTTPALLLNRLIIHNSCCMSTFPEYRSDAISTSSCTTPEPPTR